MRALAAALASLLLMSAPPESEGTVIRPQAGPQEAFLSTPADIAIAGGAAGGGKTWALLLEPLRHIDNPEFGAVIFRRTYPQVTFKGGLWDEAAGLYPLFGGTPNQNDLAYRFPSGMTVDFAHMQHAKHRLSWKGAQVPLLLFDQVEEFEEDQFWYLLTRNRSARAGIAPYVRATCNPVPDDDEVGGWLNKFVAWWWDPNTGYAIPERSGVIRWVVRHDQKLFWDDSREAVVEQVRKAAQAPDLEVLPLSVTFIPAKLDDNQELVRRDPTYRAKLMSQSLVDRERLLRGNWKIRPEAGLVFNRAWFKTTLDAIPSDVVAWLRYWDKAGTQGGGKYSAGVLLGRRPNGRFVIADIVRGQWGALERETTILQTAQSDRIAGRNVQIWVEQEPGSGGKESAENTVRNLAGFTVHSERVTGDKLTRAKPLSAQAEAGNIELLAKPWREEFLAEAHRFNGVTGVMDQIDAASGAFNKLALTVVAAAGAAKADTKGLAANYGQQSAGLFGGVRRS